MLSQPVLIHNQYYNSLSQAGNALQIDSNTVRNRIKLGVEGYSFCSYRHPMKRKCSQCKKIKPLEEFKKAKNNRCGRSYWCKKCQASDVVNYLQTDRGKKLSKKRFKKYRKTDTCKKARVRYKQGATGKAAKARYAHQRRVRANNLINDLTAKDWDDILKNQQNKCNICDRAFDINLQPQRDHIKPVSKGGAFTKHNVQALCVNCNSSKSNNWDMDGEPISDQDFQDLVHFERVR